MIDLFYAIQPITSVFCLIIAFLFSVLWWKDKKLSDELEPPEKAFYWDYNTKMLGGLTNIEIK